MRIDLPDPSLVLLIGDDAIARRFAERRLVPARPLAAFDTAPIAERLAAARLTVVDGSNVTADERTALAALAREHDLSAVALVLAGAADGRSASVRALLEDEGFDRSWLVDVPADDDAVEVRRTPLVVDRRGEHGPFDIIGDVHGCRDELVELLDRLGYAVAADGVTVTPPSGRRAVFVGDYGDRGPDTPGVLRLVMAMVASGAAIGLPGNHDVKLARWLDGHDVRIGHGLAETIAQLEREPDDLREQVRTFLDGLAPHAVLDGGRLVVAHAGLKEAYQGRASRRSRAFALWGHTTGETDAYGLPVRLDWGAEYRGRAAVVYGHTPVVSPTWVHNTICIDTGCVFGGSLTALRWPEREIVSVAATRTHYVPPKPFRRI